MEKIPVKNIWGNPFIWLFCLGFFSFGVTLSLIFDITLILPLVALAAILCLFLFFRSPLLLLSLLIIVRMSLDYSAQYFSLTLFDVNLSLSQLIGIAIAFLGILIIAFKHRTLPSFPLKTPFLILFLWGSATLAYSVAPYETLEELLRFFDLFTLSFLAFIGIATPSDFRKLLLAFFASAFLPIIFALYQFIFSIGFADDAVTIPRIFGTFSHPNIFSLYLFTLIVFALLFLLAFIRSQRERIFTSILLGILIITLLLTFARVAWVILFIFTFLLALFRYRLLLIPLIFFPLVLFAFSQNFQDRVIDSFTPDPDSSIVWRQNLWYDVTAKSIQDGNKWFGSGMNTFPLVSESLRGARFGSNDAHNDFVKFFVEGGLIGLFASALYSISILILLIRAYHKSAPDSMLQIAFGMMFLLFCSLSIASLSDNVFKNTPVQWLFFIALGGLLGLSKKSKQ